MCTEQTKTSFGAEWSVSFQTDKHSWRVSLNASDCIVERCIAKSLGKLYDNDKISILSGDERNKTSRVISPTEGFKITQTEKNGNYRLRGACVVGRREDVKWASLLVSLWNLECRQKVFHPELCNRTQFMNNKGYS